MHTCVLLKDSVITDLVWDVKGMKVFFGDDQGRIAVSGVPKVSASTYKNSQLENRWKLCIERSVYT